MDLRKISVFALLVLTAGSLVFTSCSKSNNNSNVAISATIGSTTFSGNNLTGGNGIFWTSGNYFDIAGLTVNGKDSAILDVNIGSPVVLNRKVSSDTDYDAAIEYLPSGLNGND